MLRGMMGFRPILTDLTLLLPDGVGGGGGVPDDDSDIDKMDELGDAGKDALRKERKARREADAAAKTTQDTLKSVQDQLKVLQDADAERQREAAKKAEKDQEAAGKFEDLARTREQERDKAVADLAALQTRFDALNKAAGDVVKADFDTLPEEIRDLFTGSTDDPVAMLAFIPKGKKAAEALKPAGNGNGEGDGMGDGAKPKPPATPPSTPVAPTDDEAARKAFSSNYY